MARKPCAQSVEQLIINELNCGCKEPKGRFNRIARNAILPFYYNCNINLGNISNTNETCAKVFYIKNPQFFSGASVNIPGSQVTQAMRYAQLARKTGRSVEGRRGTIIIPYVSGCKPYPSIFDKWYPDARSEKESVEEETAYLNRIGTRCMCAPQVGNILSNN